ncbi:hypothetical protein N9Y42_07190 [Mariniblastus sp.]|nr:hypothetical protein [Mariniblastus sp.]
MSLNYQIWADGPVDHESSNQKSIKKHVGIHAVAKRPQQNQYEIANEVVCLSLARRIDLPVPEGIVLELDSEYYFASLCVAKTAQKPPPADTQWLAENLSTQCTGGMVFDCWICNIDRHAENIVHREATDDLYFIDHGDTLFTNAGEQYFAERASDFALDYAESDLLLDAKNLEGLGDWVSRICEIPEKAIRRSVKLAIDYGVSEDCATCCANFLIERRTRLLDWFLDKQSNREVFPNMTRGLFEGGHDD